MAVKIVDLQLIYGVAGAREKFEDLTTKLVKGEVTDADGVRTQQGDGGLDIYDGQFNDPAGIDVYQCKFFPQGVGEAQQKQIRESYQRCRDGGAFRTKKWTLCLPVDLSLGELKWFNEWRQKRAGDGIEIADPWGATKLEWLLYQVKNRGVLEAFFKQEHLTQIRDMHTTLAALVSSFADRRSEEAADREAARAATERDRTSAAVTAFVESMRADFHKLVAPPPRSMSELQAAKQAGDDARVRELDARSSPPGHWEIVIYPARLAERPVFGGLADCRKAVEESAVGCLSRRKFPASGYDGRTVGSDYAGWTWVTARDVEAWRFSERGVFAWMSPIEDDFDFDPEAAWDDPGRPRFLPRKLLDLDDAVKNITIAFRFAASLSKRLRCTEDEEIVVSVRLARTAGRALHTPRDYGRMRGVYRASTAELQNAWHCTRAELESSERSVEACVWFLERFNMPVVDKDVIIRIQHRVLPD